MPLISPEAIKGDWTGFLRVDFAKQNQLKKGEVKEA